MLQAFMGVQHKCALRLSGFAVPCSRRFGGSYCSLFVWHHTALSDNETNLTSLKQAIQPTCTCAVKQEQDSHHL